MAAGSGQRAAGKRQVAAGSGQRASDKWQRAAGSGQRAAGSSKPSWSAALADSFCAPLFDLEGNVRSPVMPVASVVSNRDVLDRIFRSAPVTDEGLERLRRTKAVCKLWCRVARHVITDAEWFDFGNEIPLSQWARLLRTEGLRLPLQCTLHPKLTFITFNSSYGPTVGQCAEGDSNAKPGNPLCSVVGSLCDLVVWRTNPESCLAEANYEIQRMVLKVDGVEEPFDTVWSALATKFKLDRACMYECTANGVSTTKNELEVIGIGFNLQNKFWQDLSTLGNILFECAEKLYRPDGSPCVVTDRPA